jgi:methylenetetrahydrofolate reductase (NADPH)
MHISEILSQNQPSCSFEFFPPKTEPGAARLFDTIRTLEPLKPAFVSVTYGAGGSTRELTHELVIKIRTSTSIETIPHLTCVCHSEEDIAQILSTYAGAGVDNILALGGDPPRHLGDYDRSHDRFRFAADLVAFVRQFGESGRERRGKGFGIGVAGFPEGHPATPNRLVEMDHLKAKVDAGADYICTQLFFDNNDFWDFRERCELAGIRAPIIAGIMPITSIQGMGRMAEFALGARFPAKLQRALARCQDDPRAVERVGVHWATEQCRDLADGGVAGLHFYTLNRSTATLEIYRNLGLSDSQTLRKAPSSRPLRVRNSA